MEVGEAYISDFESGSRISPILMLNTQTKKIAISAGPSMYSSRRQQRRASTTMGCGNPSDTSGLSCLHRSQ